MRLGRGAGERQALTGNVSVPGDKSISHRALLLGALASGQTRVLSLNSGADVRATARVLGQLGVELDWPEDNDSAEVEGSTWSGLKEPKGILDVGNSGTTIRTVSGICAAVEGLSILTGDDSVCARPMLRVVAPLRQMGAQIDGRAFGDLAPLAIRGGSLTGIEFEPTVASAQVKTALLLAGLSARGSTTVREPQPSRDHTERMLSAAGVAVERDGTAVTVVGGSHLQALDLTVPGDISSATFLVVAALLVPGSDLTISDVGLNPSRTGALTVLERMGARIKTEVTGSSGGEPAGSIHVETSGLSGTEVAPEEVPGLIDEIPILAVAASQAEGETVIRGAGELRVKESDRIATLVEGLGALGGDLEAIDDGLRIRGPSPLRGAQVDSRSDHRMAMAFAIAGLLCEENVRVSGWRSVETSFPEFLDVLGAARSGRR